jgi:hypothetical protein
VNEADDLAVGRAIDGQPARGQGRVDRAALEGAHLRIALGPCEPRHEKKNRELSAEGAHRPGL